MRKNVSLIFTALFLSAIATTVSAQRSTENNGGYYVRDSSTRGDYTLVFVSKDSLFDPATKQKMIEAFFTVYPQEAKRFNPNTLAKIYFVIDPAYAGVAATGNGVARYNPKWLKDHPEDIDVVTHEVMHVVQAYRQTTAPGWLTEGIADYVRYVYGVNNIKGNWALPNYKEGQTYTNSYRITARFLLWLEKNVRKTIVDELDKSARDKTYTAEIWKEKTGKTLDELWADYVANPALELVYR
jgi:hypothetical protein